jgi:hypothetical protein
MLHVNRKIITVEREVIGLSLLVDFFVGMEAVICGTPIGERHRAGCDIERCPHCGWQADPNDAPRQAWNGKWPGEDDCERLGFYCTVTSKGNPPRDRRR